MKRQSCIPGCNNTQKLMIKIGISVKFYEVKQCELMALREEVKGRKGLSAVDKVIISKN